MIYDSPFLILRLFMETAYPLVEIQSHSCSELHLKFNQEVIRFQTSSLQMRLYRNRMTLPYMSAREKIGSLASRPSLSDNKLQFSAP